MSQVRLASPVPPLSQRAQQLSRDLWSGVLAGQVAGLIMAAVVMLVFTILGKGPLFPVQVIGATVFGDAGLVGVHVPALLMGLVLHQLGPALVWGLVFGLAVHLTRVRHGAGFMLMALATGIASQLIDVNLILPFVMKGLHGHDLWADNVPALWSWAAHLVFGASLVTFAPIARKLQTAVYPKSSS